MLQSPRTSRQSVSFSMRRNASAGEASRLTKHVSSYAMKTLYMFEWGMLFFHPGLVLSVVNQPAASLPTNVGY